MRKLLQGYALRRRIGLLLHRWHRRVGSAASLFLIWMAVSGWLLNHTSGLALAQTYLTADVITSHYGIRAAMPARAFVAGSHWLVSGEEAAVLDGKKIAVGFSQPRGMVAQDDMLFVADGAQLFLLDGAGNVIDKVPVPMAIERIGEACGGVVIADNSKQLMTTDGVAFSACTEAAQWSHEKLLTEAQRAQLAPLLRAGISLERLLLDLHSGRFFGAWGPLFVDAIGLAMVVLALSGLWLFVRHGSRRRTR